MKTVLITGGAKGIGKQICLEFAKMGYNIAINFNTSNIEAEKLLAELQSLNVNAIIIKGDISDKEQAKNIVNQTLEHFKNIDVLVNNAGISYSNLLISESFEQTTKLIQTNLIGTIEITKNVLSNMVKNSSGRIINISSMWGNVGASCEATYSASKAGIIGLTKALAKEYAGSNININCVCPGFIDTDMNSHLSKDERDEFIKSIPLERSGTPQDIANLVYFLASDKASYITGQIITVDGGLTI